MASPYDSRYNHIRSRIEHYADMYGIPRDVAVWQIWQESGFRSNVCSGANACGIAQFIPGTAARYGVNRNDVESSLDGWGRYMRDLLNMFGGRIDLALAGYNSGENRSEYRNAAREGREINWSIMPQGVRSETQNYVKGILRNAGASIGSLLGGGSVTTDPGTVVGVTGSTTMFMLGLLLVVLLIDE